MQQGPWCVLFLVIAVVPAAGQVDQARAEQYFKEARALCERDGGRLWGVSLCGPMIIADATTGTIATSQPAPVGDRPRELGLVNAPLQWGGITWSAYVWQMIPKDDQAARGRLFMHELFHRIQPGLGLMAPSAGENSHLDSLEGRYWMRLEWRALAGALGASGAARTSAIADALAFRAARHQRFPGAAAEEHAVDINEGIATYTQYVTGSDSALDASRHAMATLATSETGPSFVRTFAYASGAGYGLLLDALSPGWHRKITAASDFGQLVSAAAGVTAVPDAAAAAARYDGASLRVAEEQRDRAQQAVIAELRRRYVDGPVLIVPRAGRGSVNNAGATVIPGAGTVFRAMANKGAWGFFDAPGGALISVDGQTISLPAPIVVDATTLKGDGWTATVGPGWTVQPGPRPGSFRVVRQ
ncbi:MAG TPA: hypothetical protein VM493_08110 [Vicinamibacterales bacterium]|nr:hypothetical protein [Vicinamibacterales bacterium]